MKTLSKIFLLFSPLAFLFAGLFLSMPAHAQENTNFVDLGVEFTNAPPSVKINGVFGVSGRVFMEANSSAVPTSETISVSIVLRDPNGIILDTHTQSWGGFTQTTNGTLKKSSGDQMLFQIPWSQSINWSDGARWTLSAVLTTSSIDENTGNDSTTISFGLDVPDLRVSAETVSAVGPISGVESDDFVPNTNYTVSGSVTNFSNVPTQPGIYIPVTAQLVRVGESGDSQGVMDEETILLPQEDQFEMLFPNASWDFKIENLFLPPDASGNFAVLLRVNQQNIPGGPVQVESNYENNTDLHPDAPFINISTTSDVNDTNAQPDLRYVQGSYSGERGIFRGLEPAYLSFAIRNSGNRPVARGDIITAKILLSKDLIEDESDFIIREFNLGGSGIGEGLLAGETINLTWFQQMPDNFEGDYYLIISIDNLGTESTTSIDSTPIITLVSQDAGTTSILGTSVDGAVQPAERPDSSNDGRFVTYEKTLLVNGQELQQIYIIDREQPNPQPKLISRAYSSTSFFPIAANGNSFRPKISADGSTVVFYSNASDLVPGDTNNKEDVFLYRLSTDTMFRAVITNSTGSSTEQLNGRSLYPDVNKDGSKIVFESDATNEALSSNDETFGSEIFLWTLDENGGGTLEVITQGNGNSYNPSIDDEGKYVVFDSFANDFNLSKGPADTNGLRDVFLMDIEDKTYNSIWRANLNFSNEQAEGGASLNARISGDGTRIVFESKAQNLVSGAGIAKIEVVEGGYGYKGRPTVRIFDEEANASGAFGSGAILTLKEDGINLLEEINSDAILIIDSGIGYISPRVEITHDPAYPAPIQKAKAVAYLSNPDGDVYYIDVNDTIGSNPKPSYSKRISESSDATGGNFGSRDLSISSDGNAIVYSTKSSNLLPQQKVRDDGKTFYNSNYILPSAKAILVGGIGEIEISTTGSGYTAGTLRIDDLSGAGSGAEASYRVDNRGRIVSIDILNPGQNYRLDQTIVSVSEPRGGSGFTVGKIRFEPTSGEGTTRRGGGRIYKVEMSEFGYGYKIGDDENASFSDIFQFEGDGADLNEDGFPDGRLNPDRIKNINGSLFLEQQFDIEILSLGADLLNTTLSISDNNNSLDPLFIQFSDSTANTATTIIVNATKDRNDIRDEIIALLVDHMGGGLTGNEDVEKAPVIDNNQTGSSKFRFSALSGSFKSSNLSAIHVKELSNMLVMGSGYTTATPVINQVPSIFGFSEIKSNPSFETKEGAGRVALLSEEDFESDDIILYYVDEGQNYRVSTSSFGMPIGYRSNNSGQPTPLSNRYPTISGNGRYAFFSSDAWGNAGLAFSSSNQQPLDYSATRDIYIRDLKTNTASLPNSELELLYPKGGVEPFAPKSSIPVIADLNHTGNVSRIAMILNQTDLGSMTLFGGGRELANYNSGRYTSIIPELDSGEYSLQLVGYGQNNQVIATSSLIRFKVKEYEGSLPPNVEMEKPEGFTAVTHTSVIPLSSIGNDPDGAITGIQYYIDGVKYKNALPRKPGLSEDTQSYTTSLRISDALELLDKNYTTSGVLSLFVIGTDNSGNNVASDIYNISFTSGDILSEIKINKGLTSTLLHQGTDFNRTIEDGKITQIEIEDFELPQGIYSARVDVLSLKGKGAVIESNYTTISTDSNHTRWIKGLKVKSGGRDYDPDENLTIEIVPEIRGINEGVFAEVGLTYLYEFNDTTGINQFQNSDISLRQNVDGSLRTGSGYVVAPRLITPPFSYLVVDGKSWERIPLDDNKITGSGTTSVAPFFLDDLPFFLEDAYLLGGFAQSPIIIEVNASKSLEGEKIESVSLVIDGKTSEELTKTSEPYSFFWIPDEPKDYSITAVVRDVAGNVNSTPESTFSVVNYKGSGIGVTFTGDSNLSVEANGFLQLTAEATSVYGIAEVEFFIGDEKVEHILGDGKLTSFQTIIDMMDWNFSQGEHEVSVLARDFEGNIAGTFSKRLTNIDARKNKTLIIQPPLIRNPPEIDLASPENGLSIPLHSSIRLIAHASDPDGGLKGIKFFANQETIPSWNGVLEFDESELPGEDSILIIDDGTGRGAFTFEFNGENDYVVVGGEKPQVIPSYGNKYEEGLKIVNEDYVKGEDSENDEIKYFTFPETRSYFIEIDGVSGSEDTFRWSNDAGETFIKERVAVSDKVFLEHGLYISFDHLRGHRRGDSWSFVAHPKNIIVQLSQQNVDSIDAKRTKLSLFNAIKELHSLGVISIDAHINDYDENIYLRHTNDRIRLYDVSISGTAKRFLLNDSAVEDNMLRATFPDSKVSQVFGNVWKPTATGNYVIVAVAEDFSGNLVSSNAVVVEVLDSIGKLPIVELHSVVSPLVLDDSPISQTLIAQGYDPDGSIATVDFYRNEELVGSDSTRPFEVTFDLNATGHYELYAVARDNEGNLVTSNVEHLVVDGGGDAPEHALTVSNGEVFVGGTLSVSSNFKSPGGAKNYRDDIRAMVFINGLYEGDATKMPRTPPLLGQEDPGQSFIFEKEARGVGSYEMEFLILNGDETSSATANITISESPLTDDYLFLKSLWNGLYDRDPLGPEINPFLSGLRNGSISREQVVEKLQYSEEFKTARDLLLVGKTLHGTWRSVPASLAATDQAGFGSMTGGSGASSQAAIGMPYTPEDGNASELGFYEGVADDHSDLFEFPTEVQMNAPSVMSILSKPGDRDVFKLKSLNLPNEGLLTIELNRAPLGTLIRSSIVNPLAQGGDFPDESIIVQFSDGSFVTHAPQSTLHGGPRWNRNQAIYKYDLSSFQNVESYIFSVLGYENRTTIETLGAVRLSISNNNYLNQTNFLSEEELIQLEIESRINEFDPSRAVTYQTNNFSYTNRFGQIETHDPESFFNRLFRNKYEQDPNPTQSARGVNLLKDGRTQSQFLQDFALENNVVTVGGYNYTTSEAQLAIPNVPLDAAAFAETALIYSALMGEAPSNDQVALLTMTPRMAVRPLSQRAELILDMPEYAKQYGVAKPEIDFIGIQNGQSFSGGEQISVEASSLGVDDLAGTVDDGEIHTVELFLNGKSMGLMTEPVTGEFFYTYTLASNLASGEYILEVVAEDVNGLESKAKRIIRITSKENIELDITSPELGTILEVGDTVEVKFSPNGSTAITNSFLEINGKVQWSAVLSLDSSGMPADEHNFSIDDGTGRGPLFFEFDSDGLANAVIGIPEVIKDNLRDLYVQKNPIAEGEYLGIEHREYLIEIDQAEEKKVTFRWTVDGGVNYNQTSVNVFRDDDEVYHELSAGLVFGFDERGETPTPESFTLGDRWRVKAGPINEIIELDNFGTTEDRVEKIRQNIIRAINRARNEGKLAISAEDPYSKGVYQGSLPEKYIKPNSIILHHDGSYPVISEIAVEISPETPLSSTTCMDTISSTDYSLHLPLSGCLEMPHPLTKMRVVGLDENGSRYYSREKVFTIRNPQNSYAKLLKIGDVFDPGRLPTIRVSEVNEGGEIMQTEILDPGSNYKKLLADDYNYEFSVLSTTGSTARPRPAVNSFGLIDNVDFNYRFNSSVDYEPGATFKIVDKELVEKEFDSIDTLSVYLTQNYWPNESITTPTLAELEIYSPEITVHYNGEDYKVGDIIVPSPSSVFEIGDGIALDARLIGPKSQIDRVAFYANGVEIEGNVTEIIGGYYRTVFRPSDPGDYFISVRALYGDSRDSASLSPSSGGRRSNISFLENLDNNWRNLFVQQFNSGGTLHTPIWYWQHDDYWDSDLSWRTRTHWNGASPVRVVESEDEEGDIQITLNSASLALRATTLLDSQLTQLKANVLRTSRLAPRLVRAYLYGNESVLAEIDIPESNATSSIIAFEWEVSFLESGEIVEFLVIGVDENNRKYYSDLDSNTITPLTSDNPESSVGQIFQDLTGESASPEEIAELTALAEGQESIAKVVASVLSSSPTMLENMIDLVAVQHIVYGQFFESFEEFETITEYWLPIMKVDSSEEPLKRFIDELLSSSHYFQVYRGGIPHLVGAPTADQLVNFTQNRNLFVERHFSLKYGRKPSTLQLKQASRRMLDYWSNNHEPGYWELLSPSALPTNEDSFSGLRRDTELSRRPDRVGPNGQVLSGAYESGECAVDFIYELAKEFVYPRNQAYLSYISSFVLRESLYRPVALLYSLHRENVDTSDMSVLEQARELQGLSIDDVLVEITESSNYRRRLNFIFHEESPEVTLLPMSTLNTFWKSMPWFGTFMDKEYPWIYHVDLGWLYSSGTNTGDIWFYSDSLKIQDEEVGWFWTNKFVFEGPSAAGTEYDNQRFIFLLRESSGGRNEGSWALLDITTGQAKPYGWLPLGK